MIVKKANLLMAHENTGCIFKPAAWPPGVDRSMRPQGEQVGRSVSQRHANFVVSLGRRQRMLQLIDVAAIIGPSGWVLNWKLKSKSAGEHVRQISLSCGTNST